MKKNNLSFFEQVQNSLAEGQVLLEQARGMLGQSAEFALVASVKVQQARELASTLTEGVKKLAEPPAKKITVTRLDR